MPDTIVDMLQQVHAYFGKRSDVGKSFQCRDGDSIATLLTVSAKNARNNRDSSPALARAVQAPKGPFALPCSVMESVRYIRYLRRCVMSKPTVGISMLLSLLSGIASAAMSLTSVDIKPGVAIPIAHIYPRCGGQNISPDLSWRGAPSGTRSFVLTMIDVDVKPDEWSHWVVVELPASVGSLPRGAKSLPSSGKAIVSNFGDAAYAGPCPPKGTGMHHYEFKIWALPTLRVALASDEKATTLTALLSKISLDRASLVGLVSAPPN